jgi:cytochrome c-type biogenesis protein CcmH/NrfG
MRAAHRTRRVRGRQQRSSRRITAALAPHRENCTIGGLSDSSKAVFLSYASQDAEAARRICEALRAAGVEVWFDESELAGGDAWDAKIRGQIKACALFIPVISATTQARLEGYFRIEWKVAAQRTHAMAESKLFLLPIVIDTTRDEEAHVPEEFHAVQWTRLPDGKAAEGFATRVKKILSEDRPAATQHREPSPRTGSNGPRKWLLPAALAIAAGLAFAIWQTRRKPETPNGAVTAGLPDARQAEVQQLVAKAWDQLNNPNRERPELEIADQLCKSATDLDPNSADAWAAWSQVDTWYLYDNLDRSATRREAASSKAARAMRLDPGSFEARLAQACYFVRERGGSTHPVTFSAQAENLLRGLLKERPDEPRVLFALGILFRNDKRVEESAAAFDRMAKSPAFAVTALGEKGWLFYFNHRYREASVAVEQSFAMQHVKTNLLLKTGLAMRWIGDLDLAKATLEQLPANDSAEEEDWYAIQAAQLYWMRREPEKLLSVINAAPSDWWSSNSFEGPKAYFGGRAQEMAGRADAAKAEWGTALEQTEERLKAAPNSVTLLNLKGELLIRLGAKRRAEAEEAFRLADQFDGGGSPSFTEALMLGENDAAIRLLEKSNTTAAELRLSPIYDPLRGNPKFLALLKRTEADPRLSPTAKGATATEQARLPISWMKTDLSVVGRSWGSHKFPNSFDDAANLFVIRA